MNRRVLDKKKNYDSLDFELFEDTDVKASSDVQTSHWTLEYSSNECGARSEVLWSRENNGTFLENGFFNNFQSGFDFSDASDRSTSSCSWHNDDFDTNSSNQVRASLEAIDDALYDKVQSPLISQNVFEECCSWAKKYSYFRLKGQQIIPTLKDKDVLNTSSKDIETLDLSASNSSFLVEGKKMSLHVPEKLSKRTPTDNSSDNYGHLRLENIDEFENSIKEEYFAVDMSENFKETDLPFDSFQSKSSHDMVIKSAQEKIIEELVQEIWPKVLDILQLTEDSQKQDALEDFQLPSIILNTESKQFPVRRPKTEGTESFSDLCSKFDQSLSKSFKVSANKTEIGTWKSSRSLRPNSEIHLSQKSRLIPNSRLNKLKNDALKISSLNLQPRHLKPSFNKQTIKEEKEVPNAHLLPVLDEDILSSAEIVCDPSTKHETKECSIFSTSYKSPWRRSESFLPPIDGKTIATSNEKITRNLFTLIEPEMKYEKRNGSANHKPVTPLLTSRPNTSASRKMTKYHGNLKKYISSDKSTTNSSHVKRAEIASDKSVTLFPIVTSLTSCRERNDNTFKKGSYQNAAAGKKR